MSVPPSALRSRPDRRQDGPGPTHADVLRQLEQILRARFSKDPSALAHFCFVVERALARRGEQLKEYVIGVEVFERDVSYNPQEQPVVRIMAGRLRSKLAEYYQGGGHSDSVLIELPRGDFAPRFAWRRQPAATVPATHTQSQGVPQARGNSVGREEE